MKKFNFRKLTALAGSLLLTGATLGMAAAANYPAPFVSGGTANVAIVYGTGSGVSVLDAVEAGNLQTDLQSYMGSSSGSSGSTVTGGDSVVLERSTDKWNLGDSAKQVFVTSVGKDQLSTLLADGSYLDADNDEYKFTQKITLGNDLNLTAFRDTDYSDQPTIGVKLDSGKTVLTYTLDFTKAPTYTNAKMTNTDLPIFGKKYFILSVDETNDAMTLLDSADTTILAEGETATVNGRDVSISFISSSEVKLSVDGETTNSLNEGDTYKLSDGTYVGIKDILYDAKDTGISKVEFSLGSGKLVLTDGQDVQLNEETITGLSTTLGNSSTGNTLDNISITWTTDDNEFITPDKSLEMPGFKAVKLDMGSFVMPDEEVSTVEADGSDSVRLTAPIKDGSASINLVYASSGSIAGIGKDGSNKLVTTNDSSTGFTYNITDSSDRDRYFVTSWASTAEAESYYLSLQSIGTRDSANRTNVKNEVTGSTICTDLKAGDSCSVGNTVLSIDEVFVNGAAKWVTISTSTSGSSFNTLYTKDGLKFYLPFETLNDSTDMGALNTTDAPGTTGHNATSWYLYASGEDKDGNLGQTSFNMTIKANSDAKLHVSTVDTNGYDELREGDTDKYMYYTKSDVLSEIEHDRTGTQYKATITYSGSQAYGELYLTSPDATVSGSTSGGTTQLGNVLVKDNEVSSVSTKNLIVVGGSCINSAAATLLGGSYCGAAFTTQTGVGSGQFLIKGYSDSALTSKMALLVAGYEASDTVNAATYLRTKTVDTSKEYMGTSATSATLVTESA
jgi:hypothetical protein